MAPCTVKESLLLPAGITGAKTLNAAKTTTLGGQCISFLETQHKQTASQSRIAQKKHTTNCVASFVGNYPPVVPYKTLNETVFGGNSPPKYILFKRLKIALV
ncbi:hypothetical protein Q764_12065 [Flavobacterium suncheonense GH29-5 = DSM 17707]|uniref:Uncharacterized protein n=1 Tax=Flavobacterium suncheonense GH29-5 = DSM 17707 TaxID=1121899 RepID=A0A0A2M8U3_9FLAO|nr:hypothetical protein Q764_12065 [Flavobacterium suncheonense GH29-5 = DSM 17707]